MHDAGGTHTTRTARTATAVHTRLRSVPDAVGAGRLREAHSQGPTHATGAVGARGARGPGGAARGTRHGTPTVHSRLLTVHDTIRGSRASTSTVGTHARPTVRVHDTPGAHTTHAAHRASAVHARLLSVTDTVTARWDRACSVHTQLRRAVGTGRARSARGTAHATHLAAVHARLTTIPNAIRAAAGPNKEGTRTSAHPAHNK